MYYLKSSKRKAYIYNLKILLNTIKAKLAGVIERLAYQTGDAVGIEIRPSPPIQVGHTLYPV